MRKINLILALSCLCTFCYGQLLVGKFSFEAHRGGRSLFPENTIQTMKSSLNIAEVNTLEMDLVISQDKKVVVSHDVYFHHNITITPQGEYLTPETAKQHLLYQMPYDSICKYDVGLKPHPDFPSQKKFSTVKPLLSDLLDETEKIVKQQKRLIYYNMEIKSRKAGDGKEHPKPEEFVDLVITLLKEKGVLERTVIQSFDMRPLQVIHQKYPAVKTSLLTGKNAVGPEQMLQRLGFMPAVYSPEFSTVTAEMIAYCHDRNIKVLPWTANEVADIQRLKDLGVDGVISDDPSLFKKVK